MRGPTGIPPKKDTPIIVPINNPVTKTGCSLINGTPFPASHATNIPVVIDTPIFQFKNELRSGSWIFPDTNGARTPIVKMMIPILTPYCSSIGMYLDNKVCCMTNSTAAEMVIALFWLIKPKTIKKTNNNATILNCNVIVPLKCGQKKRRFFNVGFANGPTRGEQANE